MAWQTKVANQMVVLSGHTLPVPERNLIDMLYDFYLLHGGKTLDQYQLSTLTNKSISICALFLASLRDLALSGAIEYKIYDPATVTASNSIKDDLKANDPLTKTIKNVTSSISSGTNKLLIGIGLVASIVLLSKLPSFSRNRTR